MLLGINLQVIRFMWPVMVPFGVWICGFLLVVVWGGATKRRLFRILLWSLPFFLIPTVWLAYVMVILSRNGL
jgi:hypothetical protein